MARYFFHLNECGSVIRDEEGADFIDLDVVRAQAIQSARSVMAAEVMEGRLCLGCCIDVVDGDGKVVMSLPFRELVKLSGV